MSGNEEFNDDGLRQAVCGAWAHERCPSTLHSRLAHVCCSSSQRSWWGGRIVRAVAVAAALLIVSSVAVVALLGRTVASRPQLTQQSLPPVLVADLFKTHDLCSLRPNHQRISASINDDAAMARELGDQLHRAVLVARPSSAQWTFRGAAVCHVGKTQVGHLVFTDGHDTLSIFSLPASSVPGTLSSVAVDDVQTDHRVVAFEKDGSLFCLVGSGVDACVKLPELTRMRDVMRNAVVEPSETAHAPEADLMYAMR